MANASVGAVRIIDSDGDAIDATNRLAVATDHPKFATMVTFGDLAIDDTAAGNDLDTLCGTTGAPVTTAREIFIQTDDANSGYVMVGENTSVAAGNVGSRRGIKFNPGETLGLALSTFDDIYLVGSTGTQYVNIAYFT